MAGKRKGEEQRGKEEHQGRKRWKQFTHQKGQISGQGILLTTIRRKERKAGMELIEFLDDIAAKLYPDLDLSVPEPAAAHGGSGCGYGECKDDDGDDSLDALRNGQASFKESTPTLPSSPARTQAKASEVAQPKAAVAKSNDIEAQIQAELLELRPKPAKQIRTSGGDGEDDVQDGRATAQGQDRRLREKFRLVDPEVECLVFVSVAWPMDPVKLTCALLEEVAATGQVRGRFVQRLSPIYETSRAVRDKLSEMAKSVMSKHLSGTTSPSGKASTFKVDPRMRLHNQLGKIDVIQTVAAQVPPPHRADLISPDIIINVEVLKMSVGVGILPHYEAYKRYNPQMIAQKCQEDKAAAGARDELASRTTIQE